MRFTESTCISSPFLHLKHILQYVLISDSLPLVVKKDMVLPLSEPICGINGIWMKEIPIPKNTRIVVSIRGCNRNKSIWGEDAHIWKPERWLSPLPESVIDARIPGVYSNMWVDMVFFFGGVGWLLVGCIGENADWGIFLW